MLANDRESAHVQHGFVRRPGSCVIEQALLGKKADKRARLLVFSPVGGKLPHPFARQAGDLPA